MKTYLVTGGAGFIGSNFILHLFEKYKEDVEIINFDSLTYAGNLENLKSIENNNNYHFIKADICDTQAVKDVFSNYNIDYVVNFAAESHVDRSIEDPSVFVRTNVLGTQTLLNCAMKAFENSGGFDNKRFLQISTDEVYGSLGKTGYFREDTPLSPRSPYSASKAAADSLAMAYYYTYNFPVLITRCSNNYGPYQFPEKLIPLIINNCLLGRKLPIYGDGLNVRDWLYVDDHCSAIDTVLTKADVGRVYNIGGNNEKQNIEIVRQIIHSVYEALPKASPEKEHINEKLITYVTDRKGHDRRYAIDASKIKNDLGWEPSIKFEQGMLSTIEWYLDNKEWMSRITSGDYEGYYNKFYMNR